ncbi:MAG: HAD family phosphatase [Bacteroidetes bacterium]|nr:MAG: HAD family phosphatase [Bacteroidota bacterium]
MRNNHRIEAVLFDMDGVLVDSEAHICKAGMAMFAEKGYQVSAEDFLPFTGMGENRYLGGVAEKHRIPFDLEKDKARTYEIYADLVRGKISPLDGVHDFIHKCLDRGLKMAVASSADPVKVNINLEEIGLEKELFLAIVTGLDIEHKKPAPDIFLKAAQLVGADPGSCLVVEDAISGVAAGKAAGARVLALTTAFSPDKLSEADWITSTLATAGDEVLEW